jgi:16S rRNA (adenine1518-N6/adenine1519-N6)-dimethyltransferase
MASSDERFMVDSGLLHRICGYADLCEHDVVLEVGAGTGNLTEVIAGYACRLIALEKKDDLFVELEKRLKDRGNVSLIHGDVLKVTLPEFNKVVSNIPYSISRRLLKRLLLHGFDTAVLVVQSEFAGKLNAPAGNRKYRMISALTQSSCSIEELEDVPPSAFKPPPNVHSTVVRLKQHSKPTPEYAEFLNNLFNHRNKKLSNIIPGYRGKCADSRPSELKPEEFLTLFSL